MTDDFEKQCALVHWEQWPYPAGQFESLKKGHRPIPPRHGVYLIRAPQPIPRVRGHSDVVYIGQSGGGKRGGKQGIGPGNEGPGRLFNTRGVEQHVRDKIEGLFSGSEFVLECAFDVDPGRFEEDLLKAYFETHLELPPANHNSGIKVDGNQV